MQVADFALETRGETQMVVFPELGVPHATSTRLGGFSQGDYSSMNLGRMSGDDLEVVERNRREFSRRLGFPIRQNLQMSHGIDIAWLQDPEDSERSWPADACITAHPGVSLSLTTADCVPIFFHDPEARAIGLAHAGWRGTVAGMAAATVKAMVENLGCRADRLRVALGPAIARCCFEVGPEVVAQFEKEFGERPWIEKLPGGKGKIALHEANRVWLERAGVDSRQVLECDLCTSCRTDLFYSYRRDQGRTGRLLSAIALESEL